MKGFAWADIDPDWEDWKAAAYVAALEHPIARDGFHRDMEALRSCDACVLVMPCGRSAHLELGWAVGAGKWTAVLLEQRQEPELMYAMADFLTASPRALLDEIRLEAAIA